MERLETRNIAQTSSMPQTERTSPPSLPLEDDVFEEIGKPLVPMTVFSDPV